MEFNLNNLEMESRIKDNLETAGLDSVTNILATSERNLLRLVNLSIGDIRKLRSLIKCSVRYPRRLSSLLESTNDVGIRRWGHRLSCGCPILNSFLNGGIPPSGILELTGESGSGKTQICLQVAVSAQIPSLHNGQQAPGTIYICTEDAFPSSRLLQIIKAFSKKFAVAKGYSFGEKIFIEHTSDVATLKECLQVRVPHLLRSCATPFGLIVVDSIAGAFRGSMEYDGSESSGGERVKSSISSSIRLRAMDLKEIAGELHSLSSNHGLSVICINQVSDAIDGIEGYGCNGKVASLGLSWANMVTTRLIASRTNEYTLVTGKENAESESRQERTLIRELEVVFSPEVPRSRCRYIITSSGVIGIG